MTLVTTTGRANGRRWLAGAMRPVADEAGRRFLLLQADGEESLVRDLETGERHTVPTDTLSVPAADPLVAACGDEAAATPPAPLDRASSALGRCLLLELHLGGPRPVRALLAETDLCESDLHGVVADLRAAGLVRDTTVGGERGYELADAATAALSDLLQ